MSGLHVLHVLNSTSGGSAISTFQLIEYLKPLGVTSSLICFANGTPEQYQEISDLVEGRVLFRKLHWMNKRIRARGWKRPAVEALDWATTWGGHRYRKEMVAFARQHGVQLVHTSTMLNPEGVLIARALNLPHIWHGRELIGPEQPYRFYRFSAWRRWMESNSKKIITNSEVTHRLYQQYFPESHLQLIPNGIPLHGWSPKHHKEKDQLVVGMVGNLTTRWKNHPLFVDIALAALKKGLPMEFRMYGQIPEPEDAYVQSLRQKIVAAGQGENIKLMGFHGDPKAFIPELDVMLHTASNESFGRVFIEAMACGIPVMGLPTGGALDLIQPEANGYHFTNVTEALAQLESLLEVAVRQRMGQAGRALVEAHYSQNQLAKALAGMYDEVIKSE